MSTPASNPNTSGGGNPNAAPNLPPWANPNTQNTNPNVRSLRPELQHHEQEVAPILQDLNEAEVIELGNANRMYHEAYDIAFQSAYNALDNDALRAADKKNKIKTNADLRALKKKLAAKAAGRAARDDLEDYVMSVMMPNFAGGLPNNTPQYLEVYDSLMAIGSLSEEEWSGVPNDETRPGLRDELWSLVQEEQTAGSPDTVTNAELDEAYETNRKIDELTEKLKAARETTEKALDDYAKRSAQQRNGHLGRVSGNRFRDKLMRLFTSGISTKRSEALDEEVGKARDAYRDAFKDERNLLKELAELQGVPEQELKKELMDFQLNEQLQLENSIMEAQKLDGKKSWVVKKWTKSGKFGKIMMVALPAALVGVTGGLAAAWLGLSGAAGVAANVAAGAVTAYTGRKTGHKIAGKVNRDFAHSDLAEEHFKTRQSTEAAKLKTALENAAAGDLVDHTNSVEEETEERVKANQRRRRLAGTIGSVAAGFGFTGGRIVGGHFIHEGLFGHHDTAIGNNIAKTPKGGGSGAHPPVHPNAAAHLPSSHVNQYPWTDAHYLTPGREFPTMQHAMDAWNQANAGANLHFVNVGDTIQIYDGTRALNQAQQTAFNTFMERVTTR